MHAVEVKDLKKIYKTGDGQLNALAGVSFQVESRELIAIVGESGSGKSTLLHILGTLDTPSSGLVKINGHNPFSSTDQETSLFRNRHIGFVFQHNNLLAEFTALENVMMPGLIGGEPEKNVKEKAERLLEKVGLTARLKHFPSQLSGGEQQRVAIARSLVNDPVFVLADEPSGNLDSKNAAQVHELFYEINSTLGSTILIVTHNKEFAATLPRRLHLRDGLITADERS